MVTLPSFEQLGMVTPQPAQGPLLSPDVAEEADKAGEQLGQTVTRVGYDVSRADYYEGNLQRGYAEANLKNGMVALQQEIQSDPTNYATASERFQKGYQDLLNQQKQTIDDPVQQQKFMATGLSTMALGQKQIDLFAHQASKADQVSKLDVLNANLIQSSLQNPAMMASNIQSMQNAIQATVQTGAMDQSHATLYGQQVMEKLATARLKFMPATQQVQVLQPLIDQAQGNSGGPSIANSNLPTTSDTAIPYVMNRLEGAHLVQNDNGSGPSRYGIVAADNDLTPAQVANLAPDKAAQLYKTNYWDKIGADNLPANMRLVAFDTAVQFGPETAQKMITAADGDPQKLLDLRSQAYQTLIAENPTKYGGSAQAWSSRQQLLSQALAGQDKKNVTDWTQMLPAEKIPELYQQAQQGVRADFVDEERVQKMQEEQTRAAQESTMNGYLNDALSGKLSADTIAKDQTLTFEQREKMLTMMHTVANRGEQTDPSTFITLFDRIHAADGTPNKITNPDDLVPFVGNGLGYQDLIRLRGEIQNKGTPDGDAEAQQRAQTFKVVRGMLTGSDDGLGIKDPKGDEIYAHAMNLMYQKIKDGKDEGVPASQLYDPTSPNWVGNVAKGLKRPESQWYSDLTIANGSSGQNMVNTSTPQGLVAAVNANRISRAEGEAIALKNGWIRASPPEVPTAQ